MLSHPEVRSYWHDRVRDALAFTPPEGFFPRTRAKHLTDFAIAEGCVEAHAPSGETIRCRVPAATDEETALAGIAAMEEFYRELKMPVTIRELGIEPTGAQLKEMAEKCASKFENGAAGTMKKLSAEDMEKIFRAAM